MIPHKGKRGAIGPGSEDTQPVPFGPKYLRPLRFRQIRSFSSRHKPDLVQTQLLGPIGSGGDRSFRALLLAPQSKVFSSITGSAESGHIRDAEPRVREGHPPVLPSFAGSLCLLRSSRPRSCAIVTVA